MTKGTPRQTLVRPFDQASFARTAPSFFRFGPRAFIGEPSRLRGTARARRDPAPRWRADRQQHGGEPLLGVTLVLRLRTEAIRGEDEIALPAHMRWIGRHQTSFLARVERAGAGEFEPQLDLAGHLVDVLAARAAAAHALVLEVLGRHDPPRGDLKHARS